MKEQKQSERFSRPEQSLGITTQVSSCRFQSGNLSAHAVWYHPFHGSKPHVSIIRRDIQANRGSRGIRFGTSEECGRREEAQVKTSNSAPHQGHTAPRKDHPAFISLHWHCWPCYFTSVTSNQEIRGWVYGEYVSA